MPHYPKPFFRAPRGLWYVQIDGRQVNLGPDRDEAFRRYHDLMARGRDAPNRRLATPLSRSSTRSSTGAKSTAPRGLMTGTATISNRSLARSLAISLSSG